MEIIKNENIDMDVTPRSLTISLRVSMSADNTDTFEFTTDIDEIGQIVLTPVNESVKFTQVENVAIINDIEGTGSDTVIELAEPTTKEHTIVLSTTLLTETEHPEVTAYIDDNNRCIVCPVDKETSFLTATLDDNLNLITEEMQIEEYCDGYKLINPGDTWYVKTPKSELIGKGFDTLAQAKIFVCKTEIAKLENLTEAIENNSCDITEQQLSDLTSEFSEEGVILCSTECEQEACVNILQKHYTNVHTNKKDDKLYVMYHNDRPLNEELDEENKQKLIWRMMHGDIDIVFSDKQPSEQYEHLPELDSDKYTYYYDEESDVIVSYSTASRDND